MSEIKDKDILNFLEGNLSKKDKEAIRTWAYESVENAQDLAFTQKIYKASKGLKVYNPVDADNEWAWFKEIMSGSDTTSSSDKKSVVTDAAAATVAATTAASTIPSTPSDVDILNFLEGDLTGSQASQVDAWIHSGDQSRSRDFNISKNILDESKNLGGYKTPDVNAEYRAFIEKTKAKAIDNVVPMTTTAAATTATAITAATVAKPEATKSTYQEVATPTYAQEQQEEKEFRIVPVWAKYAMAACLALLAGFFLWNTGIVGGLFGGGSPDDIYEEFATQVDPAGFDMIDGSIISLEEYSSVRYPGDIKNLDERKLYLDGQGRFDVASNKDKPFIVEVDVDKNGDNDIAVYVIGTIFKVYAHEDYIKAVENIEGKVRAYSIKNPDVYVDMGPGDRYGWDGVKFVDLNKELIVEEDNSIEYDMLYVLDYLMANSAWKVISSPNMPFDEKGVVNIDLDKDLNEILNDLRDRADFDYIELDCENCYQITRFEESYSQ